MQFVRALSRAGLRSAPQTGVAAERPGTCSWSEKRSDGCQWKSGRAGGRGVEGLWVGLRQLEGSKKKLRRGARCTRGGKHAKDGAAAHRHVQPLAKALARHPHAGHRQVAVAQRAEAARHRQRLAGLPDVTEPAAAVPGRLIARPVWPARAAGAPTRALRRGRKGFLSFSVEAAAVRAPVLLLLGIRSRGRVERGLCYHRIMWRCFARCSVGKRRCIVTVRAVGAEIVPAAPVFQLQKAALVEPATNIAANNTPASVELHCMRSVARVRRAFAKGKLPPESSQEKQPATRMLRSQHT